MKRNGILTNGLVAFVSLFFLAGCITSGDETVYGSKIKVGDTLPQFSVTTNTGTTVSDESLQGAVGVIVFFYTPCTDCKHDMPIVNEVYERLRDNNGIRWIAISRSEGEEAVSAYWTSNDFTLPYSAQDDRAVYDLFAHSGVPRIYVSDANGVVRALYDDSVPLDGDAFERTLLSLLH